MKQFNVYLQLAFCCSLKMLVITSCSCYQQADGNQNIGEVLNFVKMIRRSQSKMTVYFDLTTIRRGVQSVLNKKGIGCS